jgi:hypothetical protein
MSELTAREKAVLDEYASNGMVGVKAWLAIFPDVTYTAANSGAMRLLATPEAHAYLAAKRAPSSSAHLMDEIERRQFLADVVRQDPRNAIRDKPHLVQKIKVTRRIDGEGNAVETMELTLPDKLAAIKADDEFSGAAASRRSKEATTPAPEIDSMLGALMGLADGAETAD